MLIFRYPISKYKISKYLDISRYLLGLFSMWNWGHCTVQFSSFLSWVQSFDSDKSYLRMFSLHVQIDTSISFWLMCYCFVVSRPWASFSLMKDFFSPMTSFAYWPMSEMLERISTSSTQILASFLDYWQLVKIKICPSHHFLLFLFLGALFYEQQPVTPALWIDLIQNLPQYYGYLKWPDDQI